jgi:eukaryotic-like serine/threonine-protein kinase
MLGSRPIASALIVCAPGMTQLDTRSTAQQKWPAATDEGSGFRVQGSGDSSFIPHPSSSPPIASTLRLIKQWVPVQLAGEGPLGRVYRARPAGGLANRGADYALKTLRPPWEDDPRAISLLRREAVVGRAVSHPHLISVLAASVSVPPYYLVMPWLSGATLERRMKEEGGRRKSKARNHPSSSFLLPPFTFWIARQVAEALDALSAAGWMHGDVKPSNIFVGPDGHATLLDLGFARRIDRPDPGIERWITGTYHYISPEALSPAMPVDIRSDIYSLGVVIYEMLAGRAPFQGRDPGELARQHRGCRAPDLRRLVPDVPAEAAALVHAMLAKEPLRRPQTSRELIERLIAVEIATFSDR